MAVTSVDDETSMTTSAHGENLPWIEKYRPRSINEVASQTEVVQVLRTSLTSKNLPHLLFYGPPGTGKTSTILALARDLFGPTLYKKRVLELNASDERGIGVVREKIKQFAKVTARESVPGYPCPPFKLIVLDEADSLTTDAQTALRRIIEVSSSGTRFCLICNYVSRIIDPLTSRCAKFRFKPVNPADGLAKLGQICEAEQVKFFGMGEEGRDEVLGRLVRVTGGDLRRAVGLLQAASQLGRPLKVSDVDELAGIIPEAVIREAVSIACDPKSTIPVLLDWVNLKLVREGYPAHQFVQQLSELLVGEEAMGEMRKAAVAVRLAEIDMALTEGADEHLQLLTTMLGIHSIMQPGAIKQL